MKNFLSGLSLNRKLGLAAFLLGFVALFGADPFSQTFRTINTKDITYSLNNNSGKITPLELASWIIEGKSDYSLIDLRPVSQYNVYNIPSSVNIPAVEFSKAGLSRNEKIILYSDDETTAAQSWFILKAGNYKSVYILSGGLHAWKSNILFPKLKAGANAQELAEFEKIKQVSIHFGGSPQSGLSSDSSAPEIAMPKLQAPAQTAKASSPKKKKEGC